MGQGLEESSICCEGNSIVIHLALTLISVFKPFLNLLIEYHFHIM